MGSSSLSKQVERAREVRRELRAIGRARKRLKRSEQDLHERTQKGLADARGVVPVTEAADLVDLHRTTVYQTYAGGSGVPHKEQDEEQ